MRDIIRKGILALFGIASAVLMGSSTAHAAYWDGNSDDYVSSNLGYQTRTEMGYCFPVVQTIPRNFEGLGIRMENGEAHYTCGNCGRTGTVKNISLYGYTDRFGVTTYTGWYGYMYCPECNPRDDAESAWEWHPSRNETITPVKKTYVVTVNTPGGNLPGIYTLGPLSTQNDVDSINYYGQDDAGNVYSGHSEYFSWTTDPLVAYSADNDVFDDRGTALTSPLVGASLVNIEAADSFISNKTGCLDLRNRWPWYVTNTRDSKGKWAVTKAIEISNFSNNVNKTGVGWHKAIGERQYINIAYWVPTRNIECIHHALQLTNGGYYKVDGAWQPKAYNNGANDDNICRRPHQRGYIAVCADCGEPIPVFTYMTPQTAASINKIPNQMGYLYTCPVIAEGDCGHESGYFFKTRSQGDSKLLVSNHAAEQWAGFYHSCDITCRNQYTIQFVSNLPEEILQFVGTSNKDAFTYTESGYFYGIFNDDSDVYYAPENSGNWGYIRSKNTINQSCTSISHEALVFDGWYTARDGGVKITSWGSSGMQAYFNAYVNTHPNENKDGGTIPLFAHWTLKKGTVKTIDAAEFGAKAILPYKNPVTLVWGDSIDPVPDPTPNVKESTANLYFSNTENNRVTAYDPERSGNWESSERKITREFAKWELTSDSTGAYVNRRYTNLGGNDTLQAVWGGAVGFKLPTPRDITSGYVFIGWTKGSNSHGHSNDLIPAGSYVTEATSYYAHYAPVEMFIYADKRTTDASGNALRYEGQLSNVRWNVTNVNLVSHPYYKIYQHGTKDIEGINVNTTTDATFANQSGSSNQDITIPYDGHYTFVLNGGKGGDANFTYKGGNGGKEEVTLFLQAGDVVKLRVSSYGSATSGITGALAGNGGSGMLLYVVKAGTTDSVLVAAAGGGGGAAYLSMGAGTKGFSGGTGGITEVTTWSKGANQDSTVNGSGSNYAPSDKHFNSANPYKATPYYVNPGGGYGPGGTSGRISAVYYTHTCNSYCSYTGKCNETLTWVYLGYNADTGAHWYATYCSNPAHRKYDNPMGQTALGGSYTGIAHVSNGADENGVNWQAFFYEPSQPSGFSNIAGYPLYDPIKSAGQDFINMLNNGYQGQGWNDYSVSNKCPWTKSYNYTAEHAPYSNKWQSGSATINSESKGAYNFYKSDFSGMIEHHSTEGANNGSANWSMVVVKTGLSDNTSIIADTPDLVAPPVPTFRDTATIKQVEYRLESNGTISVILNYAAWNKVSDLGSDYYWNGETYSAASTSILASTYHHEKGTSYTPYTHWDKSPKASPAELNIVSGIRYYWYKFDEDANPAVFHEDNYQANINNGWTCVGSGVDTVRNLQKVMKNFTPNGQSGTFYLHLRAEDYAGHASPDEQKLAIPWKVGGPGGFHTPGILKAPVVSVPTVTTGVYKKTTDTYYVKADGETTIGIRLYAEQVPTNYSRITLLKAGNYTLTTDLLTRTKRVGGVIGALNTKGAYTVSVVDRNYTLNASTETITQAFTTQKEDKNTVTAYAESKCVGESKNGKCNHKDNHDQSKTGNTIYVIGDKTAPNIKVNGSDANNGIDLGLIKGDSTVITLVISDAGSGIKSYKVTDLWDNVIKSGTTSTYTNETSTTITWTKTGQQTIVVTVTDNVGNERKIEIMLNLDGDSPVITDETPDTPPVGDTPDDSWREYDPDNDGEIPGVPNTAKWEYDWVGHDLYLKYRAIDKTTEIVSFKMYASNSIWNKGELVATGEVDYEAEGLVINYIVTTEGRTYYLLEAEDSVGHVTTVRITVRVDKSNPLVVHDADDTDFFYRKPLASLTPEQATAALSDAGSSALFTRIVAYVHDGNATTDKTAETDDCGIKKAVLVVSEVGNPTNFREYVMHLDYAMGTPANTDERICPFIAPADSISYQYEERKLSGFFSTEVNFFADFADAAELEYKIVAYDNVGNQSVSEGKRFANFDIKAVDYALEENDRTHAYGISNDFNVSTSGGISNVGYYKTGEFGYVEVWTIGKVGSLRFDFGVVGQESAREIDAEEMPAKYLLGCETAVRRVDSNPDQYNVSATGVVEVSPGVYSTVYMPDGYARHYVFKGMPIGAEVTDGWLGDGTNIRIPPNYQLQPKVDAGGRVSKDAHGNVEYEWEYRIARVYAEKARPDGSYAETYDNVYYVIWDGSGDDLHYRITHETPGTETHTGE